MDDESSDDGDGSPSTNGRQQRAIDDDNGSPATTEVSAKQWRLLRGSSRKLWLRWLDCKGLKMKLAALSDRMDAFQQRIPPRSDDDETMLTRRR
nr:cytochrome P450 81D11-like [Ipomoea batatas]